MTSIGDNHRPLRDIVCDTIRDQIVRGDHPPGSHLVEERLAQELGVSRNPIREALRVLASEEFVQVVPRRGAVVATPSDEDVLEVFEVRVALEALAARLAARKRDEEDLAAFADTLERSRVALERGDAGELTALNSAFHERVLLAAGNSYLRAVMMHMRSRMQWIFSQTARSSRGRHSLEEHVALYEAIAEQHEDEAARLAVQHVKAAEDSYWTAVRSEQLAGS
jgi:DNA-binding GntR family transcriptional regulator